MEQTQPYYLSALKKEIEFYAADLAADIEGYKVKTIFLGGGTPSVFFTEGVGEILRAIMQNYNVDKDAEISIEANPKTLDEHKLSAYLAAGVNRFSIGLQSSVDGLLKRVNRIHTFEDFLQTIALLKKSGVKNINADIMLGLPAQALSDVTHTVDRLIELKLPHISAYGLQLEENTPLYKAVAAKTVVLPSDDECADMYDHTVAALKQNGIDRYEVSNFAAAGFECRHNLNYWNAGEYLGFGTAAHGYIKNHRYGNAATVDGYIKNVEQGIMPPTEQKTKITPRDAEFEFIMLGLRLQNGFSVQKFNRLFGADFMLKYEKPLKKLKTAGLIALGGARIRLKPDKFYLLNSIIVEFMI
jgi:oxygen-independent coproporphyrinogen-3 oxidase